MIVLTSDDILPQKKLSKKMIFLAGSMGLKNNDCWRKTLINELNFSFIFLDPTNKNHSILSDNEMKHHINWELDALEISDIVFLNLLPNAKSPISLVELGLYAKSKKLIVCCPQKFYQYRYIETLCTKYDISLLKDLNDAIEYLKKLT